MNAITLTPHMLAIGGAVLACLAVAVATWFVRHQRALKLRAHLMREAMRNHDFIFRLPVDGLLPGERSLQQTLNELGTDISRLVAQNEVESWQRLIRVLTHEIMNATAPICSISQAYLLHPAIKDGPLEEGIRAIHDMGSALSTFTDNFRKLTQLQPPVLQTVGLDSLVHRMRPLFPSLEWHSDIAASVQVRADEGILLQVLTNLAKNAHEAGATAIHLRWDGRLLVSNNGSPIAPSAQSNIFVPFFTTKPGGSGIGLALSRQLMILQGGNLSLPPRPLPSWHVTFVLELLPYPRK